MNKSVYIILFFFLASCSNFKENAGLVKYQPDEYQVETNTSLSIPPDFNIHSPEELMAKKNQAPDDSDKNLSRGENDILKNINQQ